MSGLNLERLLFDPADPTVGPMVGAYQLGTWSATVTASDLDIRDLSYSSDSVSAHITNGTYALAIDSNGYITANINGSVTVTATALDIRALTQSDEITAYQGGTWTFADNVTPNILPLSQNIVVDDTVGGIALPATPLANRKRLQIQNLGSDPIYLGKTGVLTSSGIKIEKGATETLEAGPTAAFFAIAAAGKTVNVRILEW
jgi:hypothetical protein